MVGIDFICLWLLHVQQMPEIWVGRDAFKLQPDNILDILFHFVVIALYGGFHLRLVRRVVLEIGYQRYGLIGGGLRRHFLGVHKDLGMKNLLVDPLVEIVADGTDKHSLRESGNLACRNKRIHLRVD